MSFARLLQIIHSREPVANWTDTNKTAFGNLLVERYSKTTEKAVKVRAPDIPPPGISFAAFINSNNPDSGGYSGLSFAIFPVDNSPCLVSLVVGTQGLGEDASILGRPGHARKAQAICSWLNHDFGRGRMVAWAKHDPSDLSTIGALGGWSEYKSVLERYGKEIYAAFRPSDDTDATEAALTAFLDLLFEERGYSPRAEWKKTADKVRGHWVRYLLPSLEQRHVERLLRVRRFVIIQGPPGTGKTRLAQKIREEAYAGNGRVVQFHPNTSYESFIGGLSPVDSTESLGFRFKPTPGHLMSAAAQAMERPERDYLLHIDEINRADLSKILGEAIYLLEPGDSTRCVSLPYNFGGPFFNEFRLPKNLHILGTMNSADRSIAIVDVAIRRRFGFVTLMPQFSALAASNACQTMKEKFQELVSIFVEHAPAEAFALMPGHSYFLEPDESQAKEKLLVNLVPLLEEYLAQGYVGGFAEPIRTYLQSIAAL